MLEEYALGVLDPAEQQTVERHLQTCPACQRLLNEYHDIMATLPEALAAVSPHRLPETVKTQLLQRLEQGTASSRNRTAAVGAAARHASAGPRIKPDRSVARALTEWGATVRWLRLALIAASLLLVFTLAWSIRLTVVLARERALRAEFVELVGQQQALVLEVVDSNKTTRRVLKPPAGDSRAYGKVFTRSDMPYVVAMAARLPAPAAGQVYQLWLINAGHPTRAGLLKLDSQGFGLLIFDTKNNNPTFEAAEVTLQPPESATPSPHPLLVWKVAESVK